MFFLSSGNIEGSNTQGKSTCKILYQAYDVRIFLRIVDLLRLARMPKMTWVRKFPAKKRNLHLRTQRTHLAFRQIWDSLIPNTYHWKDEDLSLLHVLVVWGVNLASMLKNRENRQNLHVFNLWPVKYHTKKKWLCKSHTGNAICRNIHVTAKLSKIYTFLFCDHLHITAKNNTCPNITHSFFAVEISRGCWLLW